MTTRRKFLMGGMALAATPLMPAVPVAEPVVNADLSPAYLANLRTYQWQRAALSYTLTDGASDLSDYQLLKAGP